MPTFYDKMFKPSKSKIIISRRNEWSHDNQIQEPIKLKDAEDYIIRQMFKTKKKSLAKQEVHKKEAK